MFKDVVRKVLDYCVVIEFEDGRIKLFQGQEANYLFLHMDGSVVRINKDNNEKIKHIIPLQCIGLDRSGNKIYDCDIVKFGTPGETGLIQWRNGSYKVVVEDKQDNEIELSNIIKEVQRVTNLYVQTFEDNQKNIETAEVVQQ